MAKVFLTHLERNAKSEFNSIDVQIRQEFPNLLLLGGPSNLLSVRNLSFVMPEDLRLSQTKTGRYLCSLRSSFEGTSHSVHPQQRKDFQRPFREREHDGNRRVRQTGNPFGQASEPRRLGEPVQHGESRDHHAFLRGIRGV